MRASVASYGLVTKEPPDYAWGVVVDECECALGNRLASYPVPDDVVDMPESAEAPM